MAGVLAIAALVAVWWLGSKMGAMVARHVATRRMNESAVYTAQWWLACSAWLDAQDYETELMQATCFRQLRRMDRWSESIEKARHKGAPPQRIKQEVQLGLVQLGQRYEGAEKDMEALGEAGASPHDVAAAFLLGYLVRDDRETARALLDAWTAQTPHDAHGQYLWGLYWRKLGELADAATRFQGALAVQPRHELARTQLAEVLEEQGRLDAALQQYVQLAIGSGGNEIPTLGLARVLRKLGRLEEARAALESLRSWPEGSVAARAERGQMECESARYEEAERWLGQLPLDESDSPTLSAAAIVFALRDRPDDAERVFAREAAAAERRARLNDLRARLAIDPADAPAAEELRRWSEPSTLESSDGDLGAPRQAAEARATGSAASAAGLYARHCSVCHGATGDGRGRAARHLSPRPLDLRAGKLRLVSTLNGVPTQEDVQAGLRRGMAGTSMASFEKLSETERAALAEEVLRLRREGIREEVLKVLRQEEEAIDEDEVRRTVEGRTTPGKVVRVPQIGSAGREWVTRGQQAYFQLGCHNCHGDDGVGALNHPLFDEDGYPTRARDLAHEPLKGGPEPGSIYLRTAVGMPGTAHPATWNLPEEQLIALVHYCRWIAREPQRALTNHQRAILAGTLEYLSAFGRSSQTEKGP